MSISAIILIGYILIRIIMALSSDDDETSEYENHGDLSLQTDTEWEELEDGEKLEILSTKLSGSVLVPYAGIDCRLVYQITDITNPDEELPVVCHIEDLTDGESPLFRFESPMTLEYQCSGIDGLSMPPVPREALFLARRGWRRLKFSVYIVDDADDQIYAYGESTMRTNQNTHGFLEMGERDAATDHAIAALGLTMCAGDGHVDKRETAVIKRYFREQFAGVDEENLQERKDLLNASLKELMEHAKNFISQMTPEEVTVEICRRANVIAEFESEALNQAAYELAVQIVAADDVVEESELAMLRDVVDALGIAEEVDVEIRDRYLKLAMFESSDHGTGTALNMPEKLGDNEQRDFLNLEYDKWRRRATHSDAKVREEATARLAAVTKARRELEDNARV